MALVATAWLLAACGSASRQPTPGSTLVRRLVDRSGAGVLRSAPGEALALRTDLAGRGRVVRTIVTFVQLSDVHLMDEESPLRVEPLDRLGGPVSSAFRPQEALTSQVLAAAETTVNALRPRFVLLSGDLVDNAQVNELDWLLADLRGGLVRPDSGRTGYDGLQAASSADPFIYRPDLDAPRHPGLLAAAQRPFVAPGLRAPWLPLISNHDVLVQGVVPPDERLEAIAVGGRKLVEPSPALLAATEAGRVDPQTLRSLLVGDAAGSYEAVPPDPRRRLLRRGEAVARLAAAAHVATLRDRLAYDRLVAPDVHLIALDTADREGGANGTLPAFELDWLRRRLAADAGTHILVASPTPLESTAGGAAALAALDGAAGVVAVLAGDTHRSLIVPRRTRRGGYWLVRAPSLIDYPQQGRAYRLVQLADGRVALDTWLLDQAGANGAPGYLGLAGISRDLAYLDLQGGRPRQLDGSRSDRNARLFLP